MLHLTDKVMSVSLCSKMVKCYFQYWSKRKFWTYARSSPIYQISTLESCSQFFIFWSVHVPLKPSHHITTSGPSVFQLLSEHIYLEDECVFPQDRPPSVPICVCDTWRVIVINCTHLGGRSGQLCAGVVDKIWLLPSKQQEARKEWFLPLPKGNTHDNKPFILFFFLLHYRVPGAQNQNNSHHHYFQFPLFLWLPWLFAPTTKLRNRHDRSFSKLSLGTKLSQTQHYDL